FAESSLADNLRRDFARHREAEDLFSRAIGLFQSLVDECPEMVEHRHSLAKTYHALGYLQFTEARTAEAERSYRLALDFFQSLSECMPRLDTRPLQAEVYNSLGVLLQATWRLADAEAAHFKALKLIESLREDSPGAVFNHPERKRAIGRLATLWW